MEYLFKPTIEVEFKWLILRSIAILGQKNDTAYSLLDPL
jgi:hypothetical protein